MSIEEQSRIWLKKMEAEIAQIAFKELTPIDRLKNLVVVTDNYLAKLKSFVAEFPFQSVEEEIYFFKKIKPEFYSWRIYTFEKYGVESWMPASDEKIQRKYLIGEIRSLDRFFRLHDFHYQYYRLGANELDSIFFVRGVQVADSVIQPNVAEPDPEFATKGDYLFSKFMALEKLASWLQQQVFGLDGLAPVTIGQSRSKGLKWTGESINLVELAYGLYFTGQLSDGKANVIDIVKVLEDVFEVNVGRPYKRLSEIRQRKRLSRTKYIDEMGVVFNKKLDDENEFRPYQ